MYASTPHEVVALGYLGLSGPNLDQWSSLGRETLGMHVKESLGTVSLKLDERAFRIRIHEGSGDSHIAYLGWEVLNSANLTSLVERLRGLGMTVERATAEEVEDRSVDELFVTTDPAGNRVEFFSGPRIDTRDPFVSAEDWTFVTGDQGLGHVVMTTGAFDEMVHFYIDVLGFGITDMRRQPREIFFMGCNPRHHSLALLRGADASTSLHHFMVQADTLVAVGRAYDRCEDATVITGTLGAHANDQMTSFYLRSPGGFEIEFGHGGVSVPDRTTWSASVYAGPTGLWGHRRVGG